MLDMASPPPLPKPAIPLNEPDRPIPSRGPVSKRRWVAAIVLAPMIFLLVQFLMLFVFGQTIAEVPERYEYVVDIAGVALPIAITLAVMRAFLWPKPRKRSERRGFTVVQNQSHL